MGGVRGHRREGPVLSSGTRVAPVVVGSARQAWTVAALYTIILKVTHEAGLRIAEVAFLLLLFSGIRLAAAEVPQLRFAAGRE